MPMQLQHDATAHQPQCLAYGDEPVARQPWTARFLLGRDLVNVQVRAPAEHFLYQRRSVQHLQHAVVHYSAEMFVVDHIIEDASVRDAASKVATAMVSELRVHAAENVVELFVQTLVVLQTTPIQRVTGRYK
ncbi:hypothetical protein TNCV_2094471 [Trichonephila clavipes]|nr:hypothetical protein TNCV_2094471 [Trichonephila clavipes]